MPAGRAPREREPARFYYTGATTYVLFAEVRMPYFAVLVEGS
jgi:hypothetical protein